MKIYVIRHGETEANKEGFFQGFSDFPLNEEGRRLARETGKGLKGIRFDICYSSPLSRAEETARLVLEESGNDCPLILDDRLKEINAGDYELLPLYHIPEEKKKLFREFSLNPLKADAFPNGESGKMLIKRTQEAFKEIAAKNYDSVLISTHACALRAMLNFLYENKEDFWQSKAPLNCSISIIETDNENMKLIASDKIYYQDEDVHDYYKGLHKEVI